jgi:hypothetical protein
MLLTCFGSSAIVTFRVWGSRRALQYDFVTDHETSQPNRIAIEYWAGGLEPIYLESALARAQESRL